MKNFVAPGNTISVTSPTNATSGDLILFGVMGGGVASTGALVGAPLELAVEGIFDVKKVTADLLAAGVVAKADSATGLMSLAGKVKVGWIVQQAGPGQTTVRVRLCPGIAG
jgi:predicted RecA/RadA family phage recombinase